MTAAHHRAIAMATRLAVTGQLERARAVIATLPPGPVVIEVNETRPIARTRPIPYTPLAAEAWIAEYRAARGEHPW